MRNLNLGKRETGKKRPREIINCWPPQFQISIAIPPQTPSHSHAYQMDKLGEAPREFIQDSTKFLQKASKPGKKEYLQIVRAVGAGFLMMGAIGYVVKLVHIPIRHLITV